MKLRIAPPIIALSVLLICGTTAGGAIAQPEFTPAPPPPPMPERSPEPGERPPEIDALEEEQALEPEVRIIEREGATIEEYRIGGKLAYVKITPAKGFPYYLFDTDGDGQLDRRANSLDNPPLNQWILWRW